MRNASVCAGVTIARNKDFFMVYHSRERICVPESIGPQPSSYALQAEHAAPERFAAFQDELKLRPAITLAGLAQGNQHHPWTVIVILHQCPRADKHAIRDRPLSPRS